MSEKEISQAVIKRLPRYYRYLTELLSNHVVRISSRELSERMKVTASQIRQDLNNFGGFGQQGYGYNVEYLHQEIGKILGIDKGNRMVIIGAGHLGQALAGYTSFKKRGFHVMAVFDVNPSIIGTTIGELPVYDMAEAEEFIKKNHIDIAALTVPKEVAHDVASDLVNYGIKAIWNFVPRDLNLPESVVVENVHLIEGLMTLSYKLHNQEKRES
ncbi:MAG: redox-sensing transcriptional repressor Rex [Lachnospiraceae bacterium]